MTKSKAKNKRASAPGQNPLRELFQVQAKAIQDEAIRTGGSVAADQLEALQKLRSIVEITEEARPPSSRSHWPLIVVFASTLLIVSTLLFTGPRSTEIALELEVSETNFVLLNRQLLNQDLRLSNLEISGLRGVEIPRTRVSDSETLISGRDFESGISLSTAQEDQLRGQINLPELTLPEQTRISLEKVGAAGEYRMSLQPAVPNLRADVDGSINVRLTGRDEHQLSFLSPKPIIFQPQSQVDLDLKLLSLPQKLPPSPLSVQDLSFLRVEDRRGLDGLPVRSVSTILSGTVYFQELNGQQLQLRTGEMIQLDGATGEIDSLVLKDSSIVIQFQGRVQGFTTGPAEIRHSLMPTWLDWLKARQGLTLLWGTAIYLFGLIAGVLRWLKGPQ